MASGGGADLRSGEEKLPVSQAGAGLAGDASWNRGRSQSRLTGIRLLWTAEHRFYRAGESDGPPRNSGSGPSNLGHFPTSYEVVRRLAKRQGVELGRSERRLTPEQLEQAYELLRADAPFRQVADQFGIHPESLRRLAQRDGVTLRARGEKLTPTQRRLTPEQQQEARSLVGSGVSLRQAARQTGISRCALEGLLKEGEQERQ